MVDVEVINPSYYLGPNLSISPLMLTFTLIPLPELKAAEQDEECVADVAVGVDHADSNRRMVEELGLEQVLGHKNRHGVGFDEGLTGNGCARIWLLLVDVVH